MGQKRKLLQYAVVLVLASQALPLAVMGHELRLTSGQGLEPQVDLLLISNSEVQGLQAAFDWDGNLLLGLDLVPSAVLRQADVVVRKVASSYMVLGAIMDTNGEGATVIPPGTTTLATARLRCAGPQSALQSVDLVFRDGRYGTADLGPVLDNLISVGGLTISAKEGLLLTPGRVTCSPLEPGTLRIRDAVATPDAPCVPVDILLDTPSPVQAFVLAIAHDPAILNLTAITTTGTVTEASGADFTSFRILPEGGTLGVVLDLQPPFLGNTIPVGSSQVIARYTYCCRVEPPPGGPDTVTTLRFVDAVLGDPPLENLLVVSGRGVTPQRLVPGTFTCQAGAVVRPQEFRCGGRIDPATGEPKALVGAPGSTVKLDFYYRSRPKGTPGDTGEDQIQGLSLAVCYDPDRVQCQEGSFDIRGTITEAVGAEFVDHHCENTTDDGDPGELVVGILVDALPPFDGQTLPPTQDLLKLGSVNFTIAPGAPCGQCFPVEFCDGADGRGPVPTRNLFSVNNVSMRPSLYNCEICVEALAVFQRGDCNMSHASPLAVDLGDPAAMISFLFYTEDEQYLPTCLDACDANDDGRVDFGDAVFVLRYLFQAGKAPPAPGPDQRGPDPTLDKLDCKAGSVCP